MQTLRDRLDQYQRALVRLNECNIANPSTMERDATIQRFEFTVELAWKSMMAYLLLQGLDVASPRQAIRAAYAEGLLSSQSEVDLWMQMIDDRNRTSHTYHEALAVLIAQRVVNDYLPTLARMADTLRKRLP